jgi:hypothetical protein
MGGTVDHSSHHRNDALQLSQRERVAFALTAEETQLLHERAVVTKIAHEVVTGSALMCSRIFM